MSFAFEQKDDINVPICNSCANSEWVTGDCDIELPLYMNFDLSYFKNTDRYMITIIFHSIETIPRYRFEFEFDSNGKLIPHIMKAKNDDSKIMLRLIQCSQKFTRFYNGLMDALKESTELDEEILVHIPEIDHE